MKNFLGLTGKFADFRTARFVVLPIPYEKTTTYGKGTENGPAAVLEASEQVELYDEELGGEFFHSGIATMPRRDFCHIQSVADCMEIIYKDARNLLEKGKRLVAIGGEHSITPPLVRALLEHFPDLTVLQLDAHADLRESYENSRFNHACAMARVRELAPHVGVGIRSLSREEAERIAREKLPIFFAHQMRENPRWQEEVFSRLGTRVYLTIDADFFDPAVIPGTGTPEPGGFGWRETLSFLKKLFQSKKVVGVDLVEVAPIPGQHVTEFTAARLIYKIMAYWEKWGK